MILLKTRYKPLDPEVTTILGPEVINKKIINIIPKAIQKSNVTLQVILNHKDLDDDSILTQRIKDGDIIILRTVPKVETVLTILLTTVIGLAVGYGLQAIINLLIGKPKEPKDDDTKIYTWDTPRNTTANGTPIQVVYGERLIAGHVLQAYVSGSVTTITAANPALNTTVISDQTNISLLIGLGEGGDVGWESIASKLLILI